MKTPLTELIGDIEEVANDTGLVKHPIVDSILQRAKNLLQKEKEVIMFAFDDGCYDGQLEISKNKRKFNSSEDYYNQTFKK